MTTAQIELPPKLIPVFQGASRYRGAYGGRGSGKTRAFALMSAVWAYMWAERGVSGVILCGREFMNSLDESSMEEVKTAIRSIDWLNDYFEIGEKYIRTKNGRVKYVFAGLRHNLDSLKSKARILLMWVDEAENVSEAAWRKAIPTVREDNSEIWVTYNPESEESATHRRFREIAHEKIIEINWQDNPWFPDALNDERLADMKHRSDIYDHVWEGAFLTMTDAQVFAGKFAVEEFEPKANWNGPYFGVDFGFKPDPLAGVEVYVGENRVWIRREAYKSGVEIDGTTDFLRRHMPRIADYVSRADSAEPKTISYLKRNGLPRMEGVKKWPNSIVEGVRHLRGYERIVIHPDCPGTARDFRLYSHAIDRKTEDILPDIVDANNHGIDALRYALAPLIKQAQPSTTKRVGGMG